MEPTRIYDTDTILQTATKIFKHFELNQSCTITGFMLNDKEVKSKGEEVLKVIEKLDIEENTIKATDGRVRRKRKILANTIGGFVAQKIFRYDKKIVDKEPRVSIWRIQ